MQCVSRAGASRTCAYLNPSPGSPSTASSGTKASSKRTWQCPPTAVESIVRACPLMRNPGLSASTRNMVAPLPSALAAIAIANAAPSAPVIRCLSPEMIQPPGAFAASVRNAPGSDPAPGGGSVIAKHDLTSPATSGSRYFSRWAGEPIMCSRWMLPSSGDEQFSASGPSRLRPASSSSTAASSNAKPPPPTCAGACGAHNPAARASRCSSIRSASSTPSVNACCSRGITTSSTNRVIRSRHSSTRGAREKSKDIRRTYPW